MRQRRRIPIFVQTAAALIVGWYLFWPVPWLELQLTDADGSRQTTRVVTAAEEPFAVRFIHSVELRPVTEYFTLDRDGAVVLTGAHYYGFGAGLPTDAGEGTFSMDGDAFVISGLRRRLGRLTLRLSPLNEYEVLHRGRHHRWPEASAGARLTIQSTRAGRLAVWLTGAIEGGR